MWGRVWQTLGAKPGGLGGLGSLAWSLEGTGAYGQGPQGHRSLPAGRPACSPPASWAAPVVSSEFSQSLAPTQAEPRPHSVMMRGESQPWGGG